MSTVVILVEIHFPLLLGGVGLVYIQGQVGDRPGGGWCQYRPFFALRPTAVVPTPTA